MAEPDATPHAEAPAVELVSQPAAISVAIATPEQWGRVAPDGTVFLRTASGERAVGSWQAGAPAEGLAHFARRFDDLRTEVELLATRVSTGMGTPQQTLTSAQNIKVGLADAAVVGDLDALTQWVDYVIALANRSLEEAKQARDTARAEAVAHKQQLAEEAEQIAAESTEWKPAGERLQAILEEWKTVRGLDRKTDELFWRRFSKARDSFHRRRGAHFAELDRQRAAARELKEKLVAEAEELASATDWGATATRYRELMAEWKAAGRAPKDSENTLWQRFRTAQDAFFTRRSATFAERDAALAENVTKKTALLAEAEKLDPGADLAAARSMLQRIQQQWNEIGNVPRDQARGLDNRLRAVEQRIRDAGNTQWRRTDPEAKARAAQFAERVAQFETQATKARAAGDTRRAEQAEAQAAQWREWLAAAEQALTTR